MPYFYKGQKLLTPEHTLNSQSYWELKKDTPQVTDEVFTKELVQD